MSCMTVCHTGVIDWLTQHLLLESERQCMQALPTGNKRTTFLLFNVQFINIAHKSGRFTRNPHGKELKITDFRKWLFN